MSTIGSDRRPLVIRLLAGLAVVLWATAGTAQENADCLMCHEERGLTGDRDGREIPVYVDPAGYSSSVHGDLDCVMCHQDLSGAELPHGADVEPVDCSFCHEKQAEAHAESLHGRAAARGDPLAPTCSECHGTHDIRSHTDPTSPTAMLNIPHLCGRCHTEGSEVTRTHDIPQDRILQNYSLSIHGEGLFKKGLTVTAVCTSCHTSHNILPHTDPRSSIHVRNVAKTCSQCHGRIEDVHRQVIEGRLWEEEPHKIPACVDCHSPHKIRKVFYPAGMANKDCLRCHADTELTTERDGKTISLYVDEEAYNLSTHSGTACAQCHTDVQLSRKRPCETIDSKVDCGICHAGPVQEYGSSVHGTLHAAGDPDAPYCTDCHSYHATQSKDFPSSPTFARNVPLLCARCHRAGEKAAVRIEADVTDIVQSYIDSIHGRGLIESGLVVTATCADCHSPHHELPPADPQSTVNRSNIADTCGTCHHGIEETFLTSIHATGEAKNGHILPTCEDCHTSHTIGRTDLPGFRTAMMEQCGRCHEKEAETFFQTFHGKFSKLGDEGAAKCYDCHGTHNILPVSDPASTLGRDHVVATCGQCHDRSHRRFAGYLTHATHHDPDKYPFLFWAFWGMTALLVGTLTFALIHTFAWLIRLWLSRRDWSRLKVLHRAHPGQKVIRRFTRRQRGMHFTMIISFFTLALTGMALKFSYMAWAQTLSRILGGFETMGILHRMGAITLFTVFLVHLWDVRRQKQASGQNWFRFLTGPNSMLPNKRDLVELWQSVKWFVGAGPRPHYGRFTYWEKFDYFAVFWGVFIIGSTGLVLWFPELFTHVLPGWSVNVVTIIHSDEALLAVAFIFTIHFFNTNFRPDKFPMDPVIFTGRVTVDELKYDKPGEYDDLVASGQLEANLVDPFPRTVERVVKSFAAFALSTGLVLIVLIVYTMLFGYR